MKKLTVKQVVNRLNQLIKHNPLAFAQLVDLRVDCGPLHIAEPKLPIHVSFYGRPLLGLVELLGILYEPIEVVRDGVRVVRFRCKNTSDTCKTTSDKRKARV